MNKKKALFTSLAALALAATANTSFAEEVDATVAEPVVAEVPATEEVAQAPVVETVTEVPAEEVAPVSETVQETPALEVTAEEAPVAAASTEATPAVTTRAVEEAPVMDVQAIANGDYSTAVGTYVNDQGETLTVDAQGAVITYADSGERVAVKYAQGESIESVATLSVFYDDPNLTSITYVPAGRTRTVASGSRVNPTYVEVVATVDTIVSDWGTTVPDSAIAWGASLRFDPTKSVYRRQAEAVVEEPVVTELPVSALAGTYVNSFGNYYVITEDGQIYADGEQEPRLSFPASTITLSEETGVYYSGALSELNGYQAINGSGLLYAPAGTVVSTPFSTDKTDTSKDRLIIVGEGGVAYFETPEHIFYKLADNQTIATVPVTEEVTLYGADYIDSVRQGIDISTGEQIVLDYAFVDSDTNGTPELVIGDGQNIYAVHTIVNGSPVEVVRVPVLGDLTDSLVLAGGPSSITLYQGGAILATLYHGTGVSRSLYQLRADNSGVDVIGKDEMLASTRSDKFVATPGFEAIDENLLAGYEVIDPTSLTWYSETTKTAVITTDGTAPTVTQTVQQTTADIVHIPLSVKTVKETAANTTPSRTEKAKSDKGILPSTGEAVSILGVLGAGLSALGVAGLRRRKK